MAYKDIFILFKKGCGVLMFSTGELFKNQRESSGVSIEEASKDLNIPVIELEQIEACAFGAFEDIYQLKNKILEYAKYLGLDLNDVLKNFNEYMFDYTSRIQLTDIEKEMKILEKEEIIDEENRISSPYTKYYPKEKTVPYIIGGIIIIILVVLIVFWSISTITGGTNKTKTISYAGGEYELTK
ncbi:MAG: helix-turn-helix domain-containing protein [Bacilli bacterium]|nr:helix-turn-helix domain-containing protein [Bacilli bacterium]